MVEKCLQRAKPAYSSDVMRKLPGEIQEEIQLRRLMKMGTTELEKEYEADVQWTWEERRRKKHAAKNFKLIDNEDLQKKTNERMTEHDKGWSKSISGNRQKVATQSHFNVFTEFIFSRPSFIFPHTARRSQCLQTE